MRVLVANAGSSSLKLSIIGDAEATLEAEQLGSPADAATLHGLLGFIAAAPPVDAVGHRIVHGGPHLHDSVVVDARVRRELDDAASIAPLHVPPALRVLDLLRERLRAPHVACFDTAFHASMPAAAATYAVPRAWRERHGIRRYGFHGLSCAWSLQRAADLLEREATSLRLLVAHLGSGASVTAIRDGHSVDTTMGFTPLEGLVMATRSGAVDPGALLWLQTAAGMSAVDVSDQLEHGSGTLGLAGTGDMRALLKRAASGDGDAALARDVYVHRAVSLTAGMAASLDRVEALVFTGGVGENAAEIRDAMCARLSVLGIEPPVREVPSGADGPVSRAGAPVKVLVIHAREDVQISREVRRALRAD